MGYVSAEAGASAGAWVAKAAPDLYALAQATTPAAGAAPLHYSRPELRRAPSEAILQLAQPLSMEAAYDYRAMADATWVGADADAMQALGYDEPTYSLPMGAGGEVVYSMSPLHSPAGGGGYGDPTSPAPHVHVERHNYGFSPSAPPMSPPYATGPSSLGALPAMSPMSTGSVGGFVPSMQNPAYMMRRGPGAIFQSQPHPGFAAAESPMHVYGNPLGAAGHMHMSVGFSSHPASPHMHHHHRQSIGMIFAQQAPQVTQLNAVMADAAAGAFHRSPGY